MLATHTARRVSSVFPTAGVPLRNELSDFDIWAAADGQAVAGADLPECQGTQLPGRCAFSTLLDAALECARNKACQGFNMLWQGEAAERREWSEPRKAAGSQSQKLARASLDPLRLDPRCAVLTPMSAQKEGIRLCPMRKPPALAFPPWHRRRWLRLHAPGPGVPGAVPQQ